MTANIQSLSVFGERFTISNPKNGGRAEAFKFLPHHLKLKGLINKEFRTESNPNGYVIALEKISNMDYDAAIKFIWLCLEKKPEKFNKYEDFYKFLSEDVNDEDAIFKLVYLAREGDLPDFTPTEPQKKKRVKTIIFLTLATIGMIVTLSWLYEFLYPLMTSYF